MCVCVWKVVVLILLVPVSTLRCFTAVHTDAHTYFGYLTVSVSFTYFAFVSCSYLKPCDDMVRPIFLPAVICLLLASDHLSSDPLVSSLLISLYAVSFNLILLLLRYC